ncbi:MAG: hypothetical protein GXY40_00705 [Syntrophomonadaceae bacterium]|jgi:hypothetical protein|nr:hypothetical protein [Syntrophomonadaceae bacterium]
MKFLAFICTLLLLFSLWLFLRTWKQAQFVRPRSIVLGQGVALLSLLVYVWLIGSPGGWVFLLIILGGLGGAWLAHSLKMDYSEEGIVMSYSLPYLISWVGLLFLTQIITTFTGRVPLLMLLITALNTGWNLGLNAIVLKRYRSLVKEVPPVVM